MAKLTRIVARIFGSDAGPDEVGEFGSLAAGTPTTTTDPAEMQSLDNWLGGWYAAVLGNNSPAIEDMNAVHYVMSYQEAYLLQQGVPEWDVNTSYYIGGFCSSGGLIYISRTNDNLGNAVSSAANWALYGARVNAQTANYTVLSTDDFIRGDSSAAGLNITLTLPAVATAPIGKRYTLKNVSGTANANVTVKGNGSENIDGANTVVLANAPTLESITIINNGTSWDII